MQILFCQAQQNNTSKYWIAAMNVYIITVYDMKHRYHLIVLQWHLLKKNMGTCMMVMGMLLILQQTQKKQGACRPI